MWSYYVNTNVNSVNGHRPAWTRVDGVDMIVPATQSAGNDAPLGQNSERRYEFEAHSGDPGTEIPPPRPLKSLDASSPGQGQLAIWAAESVPKSVAKLSISLSDRPVKHLIAPQASARTSV